MEKPKVTFKNVKTFQGMEGYGVNADVYINDVFCFMAIDSGDGGEMFFRANHNEKLNKKIEKNVKLLNEYIETLPPKVYDFGEFKIDMEGYINDLLADYEQTKKFQKLSKTHLIFGIPDADKYSIVKLKTQLSNYPQLTLQKLVNDVKKMYFKSGYKFLNTNFENLGIIP